MLDQGRLEAIIVKVATLGLDQSHLGKSLDQIRPHLHKMVKSQTKKNENINQFYLYSNV
jgi:diphthamide synthase (EF-2-diphthine--ammonia ligase)